MKHVLQGAAGLPPGSYTSKVNSVVLKEGEPVVYVQIVGRSDRLAAPPKYQLKIKDSQDREVWLRVSGVKVELPSRKAVRNYIRNHRFKYTFTAVYENGVRIEFNLQQP